MTEIDVREAAQNEAARRTAHTLGERTEWVDGYRAGFTDGGWQTQQPLGDEDRDYWYKIATEAKDQRDAALSTIAKVEALHQPDWSDWGIDHPEEGASCTCGYNGEYPCPTIRALGSVPSTGEGNDGDD